MNALPPSVGPTMRVSRLLDHLATDEFLGAAAPDRVALHLAPPAGVELSREARLALALGPAPGEQGRPTPLEPLAAVADIPEGAETLARELAGRVGRSGLFYESHLADWIEGSRTPEELAREPQNLKIIPNAHAVLPEREAVRDLPESDSGPTSASLDEQVPPPFVARDDLAVRDDVRPLVREQLAALERHELRFAIPYAEGREAEFVVAQERAQQGAPEGSGDWTSRLRLSLPSLGDVDARIRLSGQSLSIRLEAADPGTAALLAEAGPPLRERLATRELHLARLDVDHHE